MSQCWWSDRSLLLRRPENIMIVRKKTSSEKSSIKKTRLAHHHHQNHHHHHHHHHPTVTLFYDSVKKLTVAVLSRQTEDSATLVAYFQSRVNLGSAYPVSPLYYELEGYIRENLSEIRKRLPSPVPVPPQQNLSSSTSGDDNNNNNCSDSNSSDRISVAIGSLEESDEAHRQDLQEEFWSYRSEHGGGHSCVDEDTLERALEIARMHRLEEDLDVLSIYFMRQTSKALGRVALKIAQSRLGASKLLLTPYVDGVSLTGYSKVVRRDGAPLNSMTLVRQSESGRLVEYERCQDIVLVVSSMSERGYKYFTPQLPVVVEPPAAAAAGAVENQSCCCNHSFSWKCDEMALANLHRWWGDISLPDYVGQKLILSWIVEKGSADQLLLNHAHAHLLDTPVPLMNLRLPAEARIAKGVREWHLPHAHFLMDVQEKIEQSQLDDVAMSYSGKVSIEGVRLDFPGLVRAAARVVAPGLRKKYLDIEEVRPLLLHEKSHLQQMETLACLT